MHWTESISSRREERRLLSCEGWERGTDPTTHPPPPPPATCLSGDGRNTNQSVLLLWGGAAAAALGTWSSINHQPPPANGCSRLLSGLETHLTRLIHPLGEFYYLTKWTCPPRLINSHDLIWFKIFTQWMHLYPEMIKSAVPQTGKNWVPQSCLTVERLHHKSSKRTWEVWGWEGKKKPICINRLTWSCLRPIRASFKTGFNTEEQIYLRNYRKS